MINIKKTQTSQDIQDEEWNCAKQIFDMWELNLDDLDQFQKARVYTSITRATDDLTIFLIEE